MNMLITKIIERDMWHRLLDHKSKCRNVHGHRYKAEIYLEWTIQDCEWQSSNGMLIDFSEIKYIAKWFIDEHRDHGYMFQSWDPIGDYILKQWLKAIEVWVPPTAEHIARLLFQNLDHLYKKSFSDIITLIKIVVRETPTGFVTYSKDDHA